MDRTQTFNSAAIAGLTGLLIWLLLFPFPDLTEPLINVGAGILYGIFTGLYLFYKIQLSSKKTVIKNKHLKYAAWIIGSTCSYATAVYVFVSTPFLEEQAPVPLGDAGDNTFEVFAVYFFIAGLIGATILALTFSLTVYRLSVKQIVAVAVVGGAVTELGLMVAPVIGILHGIWQFIVTYVLTSLSEKVYPRDTLRRLPEPMIPANTLPL
jgi:hypothetical protein